MKNSFYVILTTARKNRTFFVSENLREILIFCALAVLSGLFFIFCALIFTKISITKISQETDILTARLKKSLEIQDVLSDKIHVTEQKFESADDKIARLENQIGHFSDSDLLGRLDMATGDAANKAFVMKLIPNGVPLNDFIRISAPFGRRMHPILHFWHNHTGIDFSTKINSPVFASADGVVDFASMGQNGGYGGLIKLTHAFGFKTYYAHLNATKVRYGDFVKKGQIIGYTGNTGVSTAPHLHYEIRFLNMPIDPKNFIEWSMKNYDDIFTKERRISWDSLMQIIIQMRQNQPR